MRSKRLRSGLAIGLVTQYTAMFSTRVVLLFVATLGTFPVWAVDAAWSQTLRYVVVSNGKTAGSEVDAYSANGQLDSTFEFNDRGRGPKVAAHYLVGADGLPTRTDV